MSTVLTLRGGERQIVRDGSRPRNRFISLLTHDTEYKKQTLEHWYGRVFRFYVCDTCTKTVELENVKQLGMTPLNSISQSRTWQRSCRQTRHVQAVWLGLEFRVWTTRPRHSPPYPKSIHVSERRTLFYPKMPQACVSNKPKVRTRQSDSDYLNFARCSAIFRSSFMIPTRKKL